MTETTTTATSGKPPADYGPQQFPDRIGFELWRFERALAKGLIPAADVGGRRWSATVVEDVAARADDIRTATGTLPDMGATRAAELLQERFGVPVDPDTLRELHRTGHITRTGTYKGHPLLDGHALEHFTDQATLDRARHDGRILNRVAAARHLDIRDVDFAHLVKARRLHPALHAHSQWQPPSWAPDAPLYHLGDLDTLLTDPAYDWTTIRATPKGRPSALARLPRLQHGTGGAGPDAGL
ncbi:hypothetical protein [Streptomyces sp. Qhu_M48]|uniref:hypothetical protein n=1 Tax=Streptomyces sp. Qhu_M48 TaxID=3435889 RepID=UPI003F50AFCB